jgi:adenosylcobinamide-phosphate synthase
MYGKGSRGFYDFWGHIMSLEVYLLFTLSIAYDLLLGEPPSIVHPVIWIGRLISLLRRCMRPTRLHGFMLAIIVIAATVLAGHTLVYVAASVPLIGPPLGLLLAAYLLKSTFAIRCLLQTSLDIGRMIDSDISEARVMLPALVGRETSDLSASQAASAVIESVSENFVDAILSPIFYFVLLSPFGLGLEAALAFKAVSTMDSMLGYKKEGLRELGFAPAKMDDLANYVPARLSILFIVLSSPSRARQAMASALRYHRATPSPNSGWPMSAIAGVMGVRLEKQGFYVLLENGRKAVTSDIPQAVRLIGWASLLTAAISMLLLLSA